MLNGIPQSECLLTQVYRENTCQTHNIAYSLLVLEITVEILVTHGFFPPSINVLHFSYFCFLSPDSVRLDNLPDQLWCCLAMCISSGMAVFSDFLHDFFDYPLHKFLYSGKSNIHQLFLAFCWLYLTGKLLQKDMFEMTFCYPSLACVGSWSTTLVDLPSTSKASDALYP